MRGRRIDTQEKFDFTFGTIEYSIHIPPTQGHLAAGTVVRTITDPRLISQVQEFAIASHEIIP